MNSLEPPSSFMLPSSHLPASSPSSSQGPIVFPLSISPGLFLSSYTVPPLLIVAGALFPCLLALCRSSLSAPSSKTGRRVQCRPNLASHLVAPDTSEPAFIHCPHLFPCESAVSASFPWSGLLAVFIIYQLSLQPFDGSLPFLQLVPHSSSEYLSRRTLLRPRPKRQPTHTYIRLCLPTQPCWAATQKESHQVAQNHFSWPPLCFSLLAAVSQFGMYSLCRTVF
ncbi:hypothetical protein B0I37DRAFT_176771 [Chaetomium sp. MPI-CAGE-AT-0009]|nr:hypothetical protein B0I37DRAFT_176771 [Chaetomium sp. MPI-CAGE-AT-0009]